MTDVMKVFKKEVEERTGGVVKVELYPGGELYKHADIPRVIPSGAIEMAIPQIAHLAGLNPLGNVTGYHFLIKTAEQWYKAKDTVIPIFDKAYNEYNIKFIVPTYFGGTALASKTPIRVPADVIGLSIRGPTRAHQDCFAAWGAVGASLPAGETYDALAKGALDATSGGWGSCTGRAYYEVVDYFSGPNSFSVWAIVMNLDTWNALTKDTQKLIVEAGEAAEKFNAEMTATQDAKNIAKLREEGATVHIYTPEEADVWTAATKPAFDKWVVDCDKAGYKDEAIKILRALEIKGY